MPQMAPISWLTLFFIFSLTLILFSTTNYYFLSPSAPSPSTSTTLKSTLTWKW
uniref:ATP synthase complex subunit 8 n=1 Tax=Ultragryllacris sp. 1 JL-2022a TaxID=2993487 RepID=A0A9E7VCJ2_9ORTH|nr:ATP synthase F0 subunit 8 [Ultragryllacris sp. 1 JL-2022a]